MAKTTKPDAIVDSENIVETSEMMETNTAVEETENSTAVSSDIKAEETTDVSDILSTIKSGMKDKSDSDKIQEKVEKPENISINPEDEIDVRSCVNGGLNWVSKHTGIHYHWLHFNDVQPMKFSDLEHMRRNSGHHLDKPNVIVDDERVVKKFRLLPLYTKVAEAMSVESAVHSVAKMTAVCKNARLINMRDLVIDKLTSLINEGVLTNYKVINAAQEALNYKFNME